MEMNMNQILPKAEKKEELVYTFASGSSASFARMTKAVMNLLVDWSKVTRKSLDIKYCYIWSPPGHYMETVQGRPSITLDMYIPEENIDLIFEYLGYAQHLNKIVITHAPYLFYEFIHKVEVYEPTAIDTMNAIIEIEELFPPPYVEKLWKHLRQDWKEHFLI